MSRYCHRNKLLCLLGIRKPRHVMSSILVLQAHLLLPIVFLGLRMFDCRFLAHWFFACRGRVLCK